MNRMNSHSSSTLTAGVMVSANVNLHYIGMLQHKFQIFAQIFIEKKKLNAMKFPIILYYLPLKEDVALHLNKIWFFCNHECFVPSFLKIGRLVLENEIKSSQRL